MKIEFCWRLIFENVIIHKPSLGSCEVPYKFGHDRISHFQFWCLLVTNGQTKRKEKYIYRSFASYCLYVYCVLYSLLQQVQSQSGTWNEFPVQRLYFSYFLFKLYKNINLNWHCFFLMILSFFVWYYYPLGLTTSPFFNINLHCVELRF